MTSTNHAVAIAPQDLAGPFASPRIAVRFFLANPFAADLSALVPVFSDLVTSDFAEELLVDVVSYAHVPRGPGLLLVGADAHYALADGPDASLTRIQRRPWDATPRERLLEAVDRTRALADRIQVDRRSPAGFALRTDVVEIAIHDRLHAPPTFATFERAAGFLETVLAERWGSVTVTPAGVDGGPFTVRVSTPG